MNTFEKARKFIYRNARPIDIARWQYHFENGSKEAVLNALSYYQNEDGGFGHALEADSWNPNSTPIQTWNAIEILHEIGFTDSAHSIISGILRYLASGKDFDGCFWYGAVTTNNDYPHASWWHTESDSAGDNDYNPTACLAGFIVRFSDKESDLYQLGCRIVKEAYEQLINTERINDMHTISCYIRMLEYCKDAKVDIIDINKLESELRKAVSESITKDISEWDYGYVCRPSQYIRGKNSIFYDDIKELADYECNFIIKSQLADGSWNIPWDWSANPSEWAISKNWWKSIAIIQYILFLDGIGKLDL